MDEEVHIDLSTLNYEEFRGTDQTYSYINFGLDEVFDIPPDNEESKIDPAILYQTRIFD